MTQPQSQSLKRVTALFEYSRCRVRSFVRSFVRLFADGCPSDLTEEADCQWDQIWRNFRHLGKILKVFGHFLRVYLVLGKKFNLLWQFFMLWVKFSFLHWPN